MKNTILAMMLLSVVGSHLQAQKKSDKVEVQVPKVVQNQFKKTHPQVQSKWKNNELGYKVEFKKNGVEAHEIYDAKGTLKESEIDIKVKDLPKLASQYVSTHQLGVIKEASKITDSNGKITYEAEVKTGDLIFDQQGKFLKSKK